MKSFVILILFACLGLGAVWLWNNNDQLHHSIRQYVENGEIVTLEARFTPQQIMDAHRSELLADGDRNFQDPELKFHPYLLMEVKYTQPDKKTREGVIFWSLVDGEMVIDATNWEKTHGFEDAINSRATRNDFKIMNALAKKGGTASYDQLQHELHMERDALQRWLDSVMEKHLVIQKGNELQLHFQNPKILVQPQTKINQGLVTKPYNHAQRVSKKYTLSQIKTIAQSAFGEDFTVRSMHEVFLPVYNIEVINPDGSILSTYWNALNGQRIHPKYFQLF